MKIFLLIFGLFFLQSSFGQLRNVYGEVHVESFIYKKDTVRYEKPKVITIEKFGPTDIILLGKIKNQEFGIKIEALISKVGLTETLIVGKAFFIKEKGTWKELFKTDYSEREYTSGKPDTIPNESQGLLSGEGDGENGFELTCWEIYCVNA